MNIKVEDRIVQKSYDAIVELLVAYNLSKTEQFQNEINKPIEIIARQKVEIKSYLELEKIYREQNRQAEKTKFSFWRFIGLRK